MHATLEDLAQAKGVNATYVSRILRLTLLAPDIVEAILDGRQPAELQLDDLLTVFPVVWQGQLIHLAPHYLPLTKGSEEAGTDPAAAESSTARRRNRCSNGLSKHMGLFDEQWV